MKNIGARAQDDEQIEQTRYPNLPKYLKVIYFIFSLSAIVLVIIYVFGIRLGTSPIMSVAYYYLLFGTLSSSGFLLIRGRSKDKKLPWYDLVAAAFLVGLSIYFFLNTRAITEIGWIPASPLNVGLALIFSVLVLEGGRRTGTWVYALICLIIALYPLFADRVSGVFYGIGYSWDELVSYLCFGTNGFLGLPCQVMGGILLSFILFSVVLINTGVGSFFMDFAMAVMGKYRGGPAKAAVIGSALLGTLSGSALSNVVGTGCVTIPAMKRLGYPPHYAGAIEACASTGGAITPPVMGAIAFVMAMLLGIEYRIIIAVAAIPAFLYFWGLLVQVDAYAALHNLKGMPPESLPSVWPTLKKGWPFLIVLVFLIWGLVVMRWEVKAPLYASGLMVLLSYTNKEYALTPRKFINLVNMAGNMFCKTWLIIVPIGFIMNALAITGSSISLTASLISLGGQNIFMITLLGIVVIYIMGMGGVGIAAYIFLAITLAPAMVNIGGLDPLAVHLFLIYYAMFDGITPPVAIAAFLGAEIAGASPMKTAVQSMRLGVVLYFIPFFFLFNPALIMRGSIVEVLYLFPLAIVGVWILSSAIEGYMLWIGRLPWFSRPFLIITGLLIGFPEWITTIIGAILTFVIIAIIRRTKRKTKQFSSAS